MCSLGVDKMNIVYQSQTYYVLFVISFLAMLILIPCGIIFRNDFLLFISVPCLLSVIGSGFGNIFFFNKVVINDLEIKLYRKWNPREVVILKSEISFLKLESRIQRIYLTNGHGYSINIHFDDFKDMMNIMNKSK